MDYNFSVFCKAFYIKQLYIVKHVILLHLELDKMDTKINMSEVQNEEF